METHQSHAYLSTHQFFFFQVSGMLSFADSRETTDMSLKLILHFWQEANKKFINHTLVSISVLV